MYVESCPHICMFIVDARWVHTTVLKVIFKAGSLYQPETWYGSNTCEVPRTLTDICMAHDLLF